MQNTFRSHARTHCDVDPEELVVSQLSAHVLHTALLLHAVAQVRLEPGRKLHTHHGKILTPSYLVCLYKMHYCILYRDLKTPLLQFCL